MSPNILQIQDLGLVGMVLESCTGSGQDLLNLLLQIADEKTQQGKGRSKFVCLVRKRLVGSGEPLNLFYYDCDASGMK